MTQVSYVETQLQQILRDFLKKTLAQCYCTYQIVNKDILCLPLFNNIS